jgi:general secretion pathway protein A
MYLEHFGLRTKPFSLTFEPLSYYAASHQEATNDLCYSIEERKGLATLVGQPGTGKTTLLNNLVKSFDAKMRGVLITDVSLGSSSLLKQVMTELGLPAVDAQTLPLVLRSYLQNWLLLGQTFVLLIDEAQSLTAGQLEEVRYLTNLEFQGSKLIEVILSGQPALEARLAASEFEALRQRVAVRTYLEPLSVEHASSYIAWRLQAVGAKNPGLFGAAAVRAVHERSMGIPRLINLICDRALLLAFANDSVTVEASSVVQAATELGIDSGSSTSTREPELTGFIESSTTSTGGDDLPDRLSAIERKLDVLLEAMAIAGLLSAQDQADVVGPPRPAPTGTSTPQRRVAKFPRRRREETS